MDKKVHKRNPARTDSIEQMIKRFKKQKHRIPLKIINYKEMKENHSDFILFKTENDKISVDVLFEEETGFNKS